MLFNEISVTCVSTSLILYGLFNIEFPDVEHANAETEFPLALVTIHLM